MSHLENQVFLDMFYFVAGNLKMHLRTHLKVMMYPCPENNCAKSFSSSESLRRHLLAHQGMNVVFLSHLSFFQVSLSVLLLLCEYM